jgi:hypothetical protein
VLLDWGFAHGTLRGWIPVDLELDIWTDEEGAFAISAVVDDSTRALAVPGLRPSGMERVDLEIAQIDGAGAQAWRSRGEVHPVTCRVRLRATLGGEEAKSHVYRESVRAGFADLVVTRSDRATTDGFRPRSPRQLQRPVAAWRRPIWSHAGAPPVAPDRSRLMFRSTNPNRRVARLSRLVLVAVALLLSSVGAMPVRAPSRR